MMATRPARHAARILVGVAAGGAFGLVFGVAFGALAHVFAGGPPLVQGMVESAPFFALCGALGGAALGAE